MKKDKWTVFLWLVVALELVQIIYDLIKVHTFRWFSVIVVALLLISFLMTKLDRNKR